MKRLSIIVATLASILLILIIIFSMLQVTMNSETFINNEFTKLGIAKSMGMNNADLVRATMQLINYMEGRVPSINIDVTIDGQKAPMFALEQEHSHMADVRMLYQGFRTGRDLGILGMLILFLIAALMGFRRAGQTFASGFLSGLFVCALVFGFIGVWALLDFSGFWTFFHQMLFWNEDWLFDATTSRMINMLPEQMFADIIGRMALYSVILIGLLSVVSVFTLIGAARKRRKARERLEEKRLAAIARKKQQEALQQKQAEAAARGEIYVPEEEAPAPAAETRTERVSEDAPAAQEKKKKRHNDVGDAIPVKPKDQKQEKPKRKIARVKKKNDSTAQKKAQTRAADPAVQAAESKAEAPEKKAKPPKQQKERTKKKLRRGDAPFELDLNIDMNASDEDDNDDELL